eukprot:1584722-Prymnesium_polylepis.1
MVAKPRRQSVLEVGSPSERTRGNYICVGTTVTTVVIGSRCQLVEDSLTRLEGVHKRRVYTLADPDGRIPIGRAQRESAGCLFGVHPCEGFVGQVL